MAAIGRFLGAGVTSLVSGPIRANVKDFGYGDLRDNLRGIEAVEKAAPIDPTRVGIEGLELRRVYDDVGLVSDRAHQICSRASRAVQLVELLWYQQPRHLDAALLRNLSVRRPKVYERSSPLTFIKRVRAPTLLVSCDRDAEVPIMQSYEHWNALRRHGVKNEFVVYPDEGHAFFKRADQAHMATRTMTWFNTYLGSEQLGRTAARR